MNTPLYSMLNGARGCFVLFLTAMVLSACDSDDSDENHAETQIEAGTREAEVQDQAYADQQYQFALELLSECERYVDQDREYRNEASRLSGMDYQVRLDERMQLGADIARYRTAAATAQSNAALRCNESMQVIEATFTDLAQEAIVDMRRQYVRLMNSIGRGQAASKISQQLTFDRIRSDIAETEANGEFSGRLWKRLSDGYLAYAKEHRNTPRGEDARLADVDDRLNALVESLRAAEVYLSDTHEQPLKIQRARALTQWDRVKSVQAFKTGFVTEADLSNNNIVVVPFMAVIELYSSAIDIYNQLNIDASVPSGHRRQLLAEKALLLELLADHINQHHPSDVELHMLDGSPLPNPAQLEQEALALYDHGLYSLYPQFANRAPIDFPLGSYAYGRCKGRWFADSLYATARRPHRTVVNISDKEGDCGSVLMPDLSCKGFLEQCQFQYNTETTQIRTMLVYPQGCANNRPISISCDAHMLKTKFGKNDHEVWLDRKPGR